MLHTELVAFGGVPGWWCGDGSAFKRDSFVRRLALASQVSRFISWYHPPYSGMNARNLKIETVGDYYYRRVSPKIRLCGRWLERAGFKPGHRVQVQVSQPGVLTLRFLDQAGSLNPGDQSRPGDIARGQFLAVASPWEGDSRSGRAQCTAILPKRAQN